jgi:hypothetical protein
LFARMLLSEWMVVHEVLAPLCLHPKAMLIVP